MPDRAPRAKPELKEPLYKQGQARADHHARDAHGNNGPIKKHLNGLAYIIHDSLLIERAGAGKGGKTRPLAATQSRPAHAPTTPADLQARLPLWP